MNVQRFLGPAFFLAIVVAVAVCALGTDQGRSLANPALLGRFVEFSASSPLAAFAALLFGLPAAGVFLLVPAPMLCAVPAARFGAVAGSFFSLAVLLLVVLFGFALARLLLRGELRDLLADAGPDGFLARHGLDGRLSLEACLCLEVLLLGLPVVALPVAGALLGLTDIRPKAFALAAIPPLFARACVHSLACAPVSWPALVLLGLLGLLLLVLFVWWLGTLLASRTAGDAMEGPASRRLSLRRAGAGQGMAVSTSLTDVGTGLRPGARQGGLSDLRLDMGPVGKDAGKESGRLAATRRLLKDAMVVLVRDAACRDEDLFLRARGVVQGLGLRTRTCHLTPLVDPARTPKTGDLEDDAWVADLDELFVRAFAGGAGVVLAVRVVTPLLDGDMLRRALAALGRASAVVGPLAGGSLYLLGLRSTTPVKKGGSRPYEAGLLKGRGFDGNLALVVRKWCQRPATLPLLPMAGELTKPLVSVVVPAGTDVVRLAATARAACRNPWTECLVVDGSGRADIRAAATEAGAEVLSAQGAAAVDEAARRAAGQFLLFTQPGTELPEGYESAVWHTLQPARAAAGLLSRRLGGRAPCRLGAFGLPRSVPFVLRALQWLGVALRLPSLGHPVLAQGVFLAKDAFLNEASSSGEGQAALLGRLYRVAASGRVQIHNARVALPAGEIVRVCGLPGVPEADMRNPSSLRARLQRGGAVAGQVARDVADRLGIHPRKDPVPGEGGAQAALPKSPAALVEGCDHCGRCTISCAFLKRHDLDLHGLAARPLLAWHCFLCGRCRRTCPLGIDGVALARCLRDRFVRAHGGRLARPGHTATLLAGRLFPLFARLARPGENVLLDGDFCLSFPRTAAVLARLAHDAGLGVLVAESGARMAALGLSRAAALKDAKLREAMDDCGATALLVISPATHAHLAAAGFAVLPLYDRLRALGVKEAIIADGHALLTPCMDREKAVFASALEPFLQGTAASLDDIPCCGAGGEASVLEPAIAAGMKAEIRQRGRPVITTCTACTVALARAGCTVDHALALLAGTREKPARGPRRLAGLVALLLALRAPKVEAAPARPRRARKNPLAGLAHPVKKVAPDGGMPDILMDFPGVETPPASSSASQATQPAAPDGLQTARATAPDKAADAAGTEQAAEEPVLLGDALAAAGTPEPLSPASGRTALSVAATAAERADAGAQAVTAPAGAQSAAATATPVAASAPQAGNLPDAGATPDPAPETVPGPEATAAAAPEAGAEEVSHPAGEAAELPASAAAAAVEPAPQAGGEAAMGTPEIATLLSDLAPGEASPARKADPADGPARAIRLLDDDLLGSDAEVPSFLVDREESRR